MNEIFFSLGIEGWKPFMGAILLPPLPLLLLVLVGARLMFRRRLLAWLLILLGVGGLWFSSTTALSDWLTRWLLKPPPALAEAQITELKRAPKTAIVVLGAGRRLLAPEYGMSALSELGIERLRFGVWLSKETNLPLAYTGGIGHGEDPGPAEADVASRIAEREFGRPLRWTEGASRDTRENALRTIDLLQAQGIEQIVIVTHQFHMTRALRNFERAAAGKKIRIIAAPMDVSPSGRWRVGNWMPSIDGFAYTRWVLHEWIGLVMGA